MATYLFLLFLIQQTIASQTRRLPIIEGEQLLVIPALSCLSPAEVDSTSWFNGTGTHPTKLLVNSANNSKFGNFLINDIYGDLIIQRVKREDAGLYTSHVVAIDEVNGYTNTYHLEIYYIDFPTLTSYTENNSSEINNVIFHCEWGEIYPQNDPNITWIHNGKTLDIDTKTTKYNVITKEKTSTLVFHQFSDTDFGNYACRITVETKKGNMTKTSNLEEIGPQKAVSNVDEDTSSNKSIRKRSLGLWFIVFVCATVFIVCVIGVLLSITNRKRKRDSRNLYQTSEFTSSITGGPDNGDNLPVPPSYLDVTEHVNIPDVCDGTTMATIETETISVNCLVYDEIPN
ncbi:uncharacterized protein [Antedon mediterranea]|uniref:uncharacterized protein n=1 Tax=Antedon mediterranea TaxID=105859 RepID=UPI003AF53473